MRFTWDNMVSSNLTKIVALKLSSSTHQRFKQKTYKIKKKKNCETRSKFSRVLQLQKKIKISVVLKWGGLMEPN